MKKISLQWRLTILTTVLITVLCGCLTFFLYKNGVYYIDTLQETVTDQSAAPEAVYIDIPDNEWESGVKTGGYQIIFHGESFGLKTDSNMTNYNFIKQ